MEVEGIIQHADSDQAQNSEEFASAASAVLLGLPYEFAKTNGLIITHFGEARMCASLRYDADPKTLLEISQMLTLPIDLKFISAPDFDTAIYNYYGAHSDSASIDEADEINGESEKIIHFIDAIINHAIKNGISDVHIEAFDRQLIVRTRQDGKLRERFRISTEFSQSMFGWFIDRSRENGRFPNLQQNGVIIFPYKETQTEVFISTLPGRLGERMVLSIPNTGHSGSTLNLVGLPPETQLRLRQILAGSGGMIVVTGPEDADIVSTLYAMVHQQNDSTRNIITIEHSITHVINGISQVELASSKNNSDPVGAAVVEILRAVLLQDPDVVLVSELGDRKTAEMAIKAAMAGPVVLSAMQTSGAIDVITAFREMKIDNMLLGEALRCIIAQRQVKRLCAACRVPGQAAGSIASRLGFDRGTGIFDPHGCDECNYTGFNGSIGVYEVVFVDETLRRLITSGGDEAVISSYAFRNNPNLSSAARRLVISGETTAEEAIRIG